jgi:hypothetical protein
MSLVQFVARSTTNKKTKVNPEYINTQCQILSVIYIDIKYHVHTLRAFNSLTVFEASADMVPNEIA